jgi:hypothetical protein
MHGTAQVGIFLFGAEGVAGGGVPELERTMHGTAFFFGFFFGGAGGFFLFRPFFSGPPEPPTAGRLRLRQLRAPLLPAVQEARQPPPPQPLRVPVPPPGSAPLPRLVSPAVHRPQDNGTIEPAFVPCLRPHVHVARAWSRGSSRPHFERCSSVPYHPRPQLSR